MRVIYAKVRLLDGTQKYLAGNLGPGRTINDDTNRFSLVENSRLALSFAIERADATITDTLLTQVILSEMEKKLISGLWIEEELAFEI